MLAELSHPVTAEDTDTDYRYDVSPSADRGPLIEMLDRPVLAGTWVDLLRSGIRDDLDLGRPTHAGRITPLRAPAPTQVGHRCKPTTSRP